MKEKIIGILIDHQPKDVMNDGSTAGFVQFTEYGLIAYDIEHLVNQEVEKRIAERMPTMEETIDIANEYISHKSLHKANRGLIRDAIIIGISMFRSRLTPQVTPQDTPQVEKKEGGGE